MDLVSKYEIAVDNLNEASAVAKILIKANYVVMLSREEDLYIINYTWSKDCNRNDVVFVDRAEFEENYFEREHSYYD
jgi:hypothetical protein